MSCTLRGNCESVASRAFSVKPELVPSSALAALRALAQWQAGGPFAATPLPGDTGAGMEVSQASWAKEIQFVS